MLRFYNTEICYINRTDNAELYINFHDLRESWLLLLVYDPTSSWFPCRHCLLLNMYNELYVFLITHLHLSLTNFIHTWFPSFDHALKIAPWIPFLLPLIALWIIRLMFDEEVRFHEHSLDSGAGCQEACTET